MNKVMFTIGIAGSGKSTFVEQLAKKERAVIVSTDEIRQELFGDMTKQKKTSVIYKEVYTRTHNHLSNGRNVIIDATNIDRSKRMKAISYFKDYHKECYYFDTPYELCVERNQNRKRKVEQIIMEKMRKNFQFPMKGENWDKVHIIHEKYVYDITQKEFVDLLISEPSYEELYKVLNKVPFFKDIYEFNQENPYHTMTLCNHTYHVFDYINEMYEEKDKFLLQVVALLHDVGKPFCKKYKKVKGHYSYYGHEYVSAQIACHFLTELGFDLEFIHKAVSLIEMHMKINYGGEEGANEIYHLLGDDLLWKLYFFKEADSYAK